MNKRKNPLLKNEIKMLQDILNYRVFPVKEYKLKLVKRLEELKGLWYKVEIKSELRGEDGDS